MMRIARAVSLLLAHRRALGLRVWMAVWAALLSVAAPQVAAQTMVSAPITGDTRWTAAAAPYVVTSSIAVQGGATLTIDAGVSIYMSAGASLTVDSGSVRATGTAAAPIRVLSDRTRLGQTAAPGDWGQWVFNPGTVNTQLDHVQFEHGRGLAVRGSAPVFNNLDIRNQQGVAITVDLAASPSGVGNQASGNGLNGISVPAGDISGNVRWGLKGIPYVVTAGTVSVGSSPALQSVTPNVVEQGQTVTLTVNGERLTGLSQATFDRPGLSLTPFSGGSSSQLFLQLRVDPAAATGPAALRLQVDAGELVLPNAVTVTQPVPTITSIAPTTVVAQTGNTQVTVTGRNFFSSSEVLFNGASASTQYVSATELRATLLNQTGPSTLQVQVRSPNPASAGQFVTSNSVPLTVQAPVPPTVAIEPAPIALPPDGRGRDITIRLSRADYRDNTINFSISDPTKATVAPASALIPAGQTSVRVTITPLATGTASLIADSPTLGRVTAPLFITADFRGANTSYAKPVGVVVQVPGGTEAQQITAGGSVVGVSVGAVLTGAAPSAWAVGGSSTLTLQGVGIPSNAQVSLVPSAGVTLGAPVVSADGTQLQLSIAAAADAAVGARRLVVRDGSGQELLFADPSRAVIRFMTGLPTIDSITPVVAVRGAPFTLTLRGRNFQEGSVRITPSTGLRIDTSAQISSDGSTLTVLVDVAADAPLGSRVIQVVTPAAASASQSLPANTLSIVSSTRGSVTPISSRLVGVVVGQTSTPDTMSRDPASSLVGVLVGAGATSVTPTVGIIGNDVVVTVRGVGLQGVNAVSFFPAAGLSVQGVPTVNGDGTELSFTVRIDAAAATGARRLVLGTASGVPLVMLRPADASFLVSAPVPELASVTPQVLLMGQPAVRMTLRGRNFTNASAVRFEPNTGVSITGGLDVSADGTTIGFNVAVASGSGSGPRAVVVTTPAGESSATVSAGNMVRIAAQVGRTYADLATKPVGVVVGTAVVTPDPDIGTLASRAVGVTVGTPAGPEAQNTTLATRAIGLVVGSAARTMSPSGWLQGASGTITVTGVGLDAVTSVAVTPSTGILLDAPVFSGGGTVMSLPISVAPDAPRVLRELKLFSSTGPITFIGVDVPRFGIGSLPTLSSISPIVLEQGRSVVLTIRGTNLQGVTGLNFLPSSGLRALTAVSWGSDGLGEFLTVSVQADLDAALGSRVLRLEVPGGQTSATPSPANSISVVAPQ